MHESELPSMGRGRPDGMAFACRMLLPLYRTSKASMVDIATPSRGRCNTVEHKKEGHEHEEEAIEEESQPIDCMVHALASYANPYTMRVGGLLKQQPITVPIDTGSTNNFMNNKVAARMTLHI
ncbi:hypothetical protein GW17_00046323 [Ensete ventricosum]|nr:hypothetical protein GW17_00046323 [Ensete ventricosum]RZR84931.1 hypothetical protein BHM03_00011844 [Ensete ventricosum]